MILYTKALTDSCKKENIKLLYFKLENKYRLIKNNIVADWWPKSKKNTLFIAHPFNLSFRCHTVQEVIKNFTEIVSQSLEPIVLNEGEK